MRDTPLEVVSLSLRTASEYDAVFADDRETDGVGKVM
jgi:hypothetical protein